MFEDTEDLPISVRLDLAYGDGFEAGILFEAKRRDNPEQFEKDCEETARKVLERVLNK